MIATRFTSKDLEALPDNPWWRYEIIDGELHVTKAPSWDHEVVALNAGSELRTWNLGTGLGSVAVAPGIIFADDDNVIPDLVWASLERLRAIMGPDRHLNGAPELIVEVLSPGPGNLRRDQELKLALYDRQGVDEYWMIEWVLREVRVYRRAEGGLRLAVILHEGDMLTSPGLPGFACPVASFFSGLPA